ncbi:MAG: IS200/IS605 family transposase [Chlamydiales bacterium]|nr:IS200/IS605 family transposase [Chlamydiales bacterium]
MAQSLSNVLLHVIFSTKNRRTFIDEAIESELYAYIASIFTSSGSYVHKIGGVSDHIHIFCTLPRTLSISALLENAKKNSSKWIKTKGKNYDEFSWQKGFGVFSVSESLHNAVVTYIENQKEHHKKQTFQDEYRAFLRLNNIPFNEQYIWD